MINSNSNNNEINNSQKITMGIAVTTIATTTTPKAATALIKLATVSTRTAIAAGITLAPRTN